MTRRQLGADRLRRHAHPGYVCLTRPGAHPTRAFVSSPARSTVVVATACAVAGSLITALMLRLPKSSETLSVRDGGGGSMAPVREASAEPAHTDASATHPGPRGVVEVRNMVEVSGTLRLEAPIVLREAAQEGAPARFTVPAGAVVERIGEHD